MPEVSGNQCLFFMFRSCTLMLIIVGFGNIAAGISVCMQTDNFTWYNGSYIFLGFYLVLLAIFGHTTRSALGGLTCYLGCLTGAFAGELGFTLAVIMYTNYEQLLGEEYANVVRYTMLGACILILISICIGWCYRSSLKDAQFYRNNDDLLNPNNETGPVERISIKREEIEKKYNITRHQSNESK
ncbi:hypothetical protein SteCoe_5367 [Stentor coeruleus]|uniref:Uncharacterized protein n=1 Tax=Stentor coeruleus TaxID=5963 RepID=A0A1R2CSF9_9CILI|nr:hypothetical protein SteCoe_5367 [Stentor coeruleus]